MSWEVHDLSQQTGFHEEDMAKIMHAEISIATKGRQEKTRPAGRAVLNACDGVDHAAVERKEQQVLEARRKVPAVQRFIERAVTNDGAVALEPHGQRGNGR